MLQGSESSSWPARRRRWRARCWPIWAPTWSWSSLPAATSPARTGRSSRDATAIPSASLWWWYYNTSKRSVVLDLDIRDRPAGDLRRSGRRGRHRARGLKPRAAGGARARPHPVASRDAGPHLGVGHPVRPPLLRRGRTDDRPDDPGRRWSGLELRIRRPFPPAGARGRQPGLPHRQRSLRSLGTLTARPRNGTPPGPGQHVDVSMHAAANVTTESGSFDWLVAQPDGPAPDRPTRHDGADHGHPGAGGRRAVRDHWFPAARRPGLPGDARLAATSSGSRTISRRRSSSRLGVDRGGVDPRDLCRPTPRPRPSSGPGARRSASSPRGSAPTTSSSARSERDFQCGIVYAPEEAFTDPHFVGPWVPDTRVASRSR